VADLEIYAGVSKYMFMFHQQKAGQHHNTSTANKYFPILCIKVKIKYT